MLVDDFASSVCEALGCGGSAGGRGGGRERGVVGGRQLLGARRRGGRAALPLAAARGPHREAGRGAGDRGVVVEVPAGLTLNPSP